MNTSSPKNRPDTSVKPGTASARTTALSGADQGQKDTPVRSLRKDLPPLTSLVTFEATARLESMTLAANELFVSRIAVSRQIRNLEEYLEKDLFIRHNRRITLTQYGAELYRVVAPNLNSIAEISIRIRTS